MRRQSSPSSIVARRRGDRAAMVVYQGAAVIRAECCERLQGSTFPAATSGARTAPPTHTHVGSGSSCDCVQPASPRNPCVVKGVRCDDEGCGDATCESWKVSFSSPILRCLRASGAGSHDFDRSQHSSWLTWCMVWLARPCTVRFANNRSATSTAMPRVCAALARCSASTRPNVVPVTTVTVSRRPRQRAHS